MTGLTRRSVLGGIASAGMVTAAPPSLADGPFAAAARAAEGLDQLHSLAIAHRGEIVLAERFRGPPLDRPVNVKSVSKTLVASVLGAAIDRGVVAGVATPLAEVAPELIPPAADPRVGALTLADLVTMQAGLERTSGANYGGWVSSRNWVADALSRPFVAEPGQGMLYSTGSYHILGAALARAGGETLLTLTRDWIGRPLGIEIPAWTRDPQGYYLGGNEMALSPMAMLRFAEMVRQGGRHEGAQVLSPGWVAASLQARTRSPFSGLDYGYGWFLGRLDGTPVALARGYGGQVIAVAPERALSIAITSDPTRPARTAGHFGDLMALIETAVLPAAVAA
jgi:CubicO group peptidase (beta-lactamase class C family)